MTWLIKNKRTGKYVIGTNKRRWPWTQNTSHEWAILYKTREECEFDMTQRKCGKDYVATEVRICESFDRDFC